MLHLADRNVSFPNVPYSELVNQISIGNIGMSSAPTSAGSTVAGTTPPSSSSGQSMSSSQASSSNTATQPITTPTPSVTSTVTTTPVNPACRPLEATNYINNIQLDEADASLELRTSDTYVDFTLGSNWVYNYGKRNEVHLGCNDGVPDVINVYSDQTDGVDTSGTATENLEFYPDFGPEDAVALFDYPYCDLSDLTIRGYGLRGAELVLPNRRMVFEFTSYEQLRTQINIVGNSCEVSSASHPTPFSMLGSMGYPLVLIGRQAVNLPQVVLDAFPDAKQWVENQLFPASVPDFELDDDAKFYDAKDHWPEEEILGVMSSDATPAPGSAPLDAIAAEPAQPQSWAQRHAIAGGEQAKSEIPEARVITTNTPERPCHYGNGKTNIIGQEGEFGEGALLPECKLDPAAEPLIPDAVAAHASIFAGSFASSAVLRFVPMIVRDAMKANGYNALSASVVSNAVYYGLLAAQTTSLVPLGVSTIVSKSLSYMDVSPEVNATVTTMSSVLANLAQSATNPVTLLTSLAGSYAGSKAGSYLEQEITRRYLQAEQGKQVA